MIIKHKGIMPTIDNSAFISPNALICGDITVGRNVRIMFGAQIIAENSPITIGNNCLIGPNTHLAGCVVENDVFIATGASIFHGAVLRTGSEVSINGVVHLKTILPEDIAKHITE